MRLPSQKGPSLKPTGGRRSLLFGAGGVDGGEFGADGVGVGVVEVGEDGQGLLPGIAGGLRVAGGVVGVAEVGEGGGLVVAVAEVLVQGEGVVATKEGPEDLKNFGEER